jgi:mannose-1-phosphate guanylyltransferase
MDSVVPFIIAGGAGSRLWPLARELFPKQFHAMF